MKNALWLSMLAGLFLMLAQCGCSQSTTQFADAFAKTISATTATLEETGVDYSAQAYLPADFEVDWTPFGFKVRAPGGFMKVELGRGRGLGTRPDDVSIVQE